MSALVIAENAGEARDAGEALALAGIRAGAAVSFAEALDEIDDRPGIDLIVIEAVGAPEALLDAVLARADLAARERDAALVAAIGEDQIDAVAAQLLGRHAQLLCAPGMGERIAALAVAKAQLAAARGGRVRVNDATRENEDERLRRLNEEVARIADTLARLTRGEDSEPGAGVREPGSGYRGPGDGDPPGVTPQEIRLAIRSRRLRGQFFQGELFADPAWDMLLDLFAAELERRQVSVSSLCIAAAVPPTTALRWIGTLHDAGLFERKADPSDRRRAYIALSAKGLDGMRAYLAAVKRQGLGIA
ncbi:winged helix DNA-binding protein [Sphingomonas sp. LB-2]|nr:winged helix DNA-binding protein [Sphingomonas caeni]